MTLVGALGHDARAVVDPRGGVQLRGEGWSLDWWIGADDRWRMPREEVSVRQSRVEGMPVARTATRVPGGDAVERVYGTGDGSIVVEVENDSPAPFVVGLVIVGARSVEVDRSTAVVDGAPALRTPRPPARWAVGRSSAVWEAVVGGMASEGPLPAAHDPKGEITAALLHPVAHRTTLRAVLGAESADVLPTSDAVARGWAAQLHRGMRVDLPDPRVNEAVDGARAQLVLAAGTRSDPELMAALEDWGLDDEAELAWHRLAGRDRRRARKRRRVADAWPVPNDDEAHFLLGVRDLLARELDDGVEILRAVPGSWRGGNVDVRDVPLRAGSLSYSVRWHGPRPALLWDGPAGITLRAPGLDPTWSTEEPSGEALLA